MHQFFLSLTSNLLFYSTNDKLLDGFGIDTYRNRLKQKGDTEPIYADFLTFFPFLANLMDADTENPSLGCG
jgi:hypothetical protein